MTPESVGPLSRPVAVDRLPEEGLEVVVEATAEERAALAADFKLPAIHALEGRYRVTGSAQRVRVVGRVRATLAQLCVVTLDTFDSIIEEEVGVDFTPPGGRSAPTGPEGADPPDEIVGGRIDFGSLTAEFLALGLDAYPKKPGTDFAFRPDAGGGAGVQSPFAELGKLKPES